MAHRTGCSLLAEVVRDLRRKRTVTTQLLLISIMAKKSQGLDFAEIRKRSLAACEILGYSTNPQLPLLETSVTPRDAREVAVRICCLVAVSAVAHGYDHRLAKGWLKRNGIQSSLSERELVFLESMDDLAEMQCRVDALFALAWAAQVMPKLDFSMSTPDTLAMSLPHPQENGSIATFVRTLNLRAKDELIAVTDLAYCLHWAIRDSVIKGIRPPGPPEKLHPIYIVERRRGLEWLMSNCNWDDTPMHT
jgi:hypothetical protein